MVSVTQVFEELQTSPEGLSKAEAEKRLREHGKNVLKEEKTSKFQILLRQFHNPLIYILFAASIVSLAIGALTDFIVINAIIALNSLIGFWQEIKAETSIAALKKLTESRNKVVREGKLIEIPSSELVPGDFVIVHEGDIITADIRLAESEGLMLDESSLTGESAPVSKDHEADVKKGALPYELKNQLLSGTTVVRGVGRGIVLKTGKGTYFAQIAEKSFEASPETPLIRSLRSFTKRYVALVVALFSFLGIFGYIQGRSLLELGYILIAALVSAVPEGLPLVLTLVMVVGALSLSRKKTIIRYLPSVETLGSASIIASDKTGTITEGKLVVKEVFSHDLEKLKLVAALCNDAHEGTGDPLDVALSQWVENFSELRKKHPRKWAYSFDTRLMLMATTNEIDGEEELLVKGAYESLKERAEHLDEELEKALHDFLEQGLRVLAFGYGKSSGIHRGIEELGNGQGGSPDFLAGARGHCQRQDPKRGRKIWGKADAGQNQFFNHDVYKDPSQWKLKLVGLIGFLDPPKPEVKEAVSSAKKAGIQVIMITGDHPKTAQEVAKEVEIWSEKSNVLTGKEIETLSDDALANALKNTTVLARVLPEHKYRIIKCLQSQKEIVAVTGDGVNDVPALKAADLGIAMGSGTEAAKSVSKMVITDNNLKVIVDAVHNARVIADNLRKVIYYLISTSLQELVLISCAILGAFPLPMTAIQILWINLVTDGVQDKLFAFIKEEGDVMRRKPLPLQKKFFNLPQIIHILVFGISLGILTFLLYLWLLPRHSFSTVSTVIFTSIVTAQFANGIQAQKEREPFFKNIKKSFTINPLIFLGFAVGMALQAFVLYVIPQWFQTVAIPLELWQYPLYIFLAAFGIVELRKWVEWNLRP